MIQIKKFFYHALLQYSVNLLAYCVLSSFKMAANICSKITLAELTNALVDEWNNIPMWTVNALVNSAASARGVGGGGGGGEAGSKQDIDHCSEMSFPVMGGCGEVPIHEHE